MSRVLILGVGISAMATALWPSAAAAGVLTFGTIDDFELQTVNTQPSEFHDGDSGWYGEATVVASGMDGVSATSFGGSQFAKIVAGPDDSYEGVRRDGPYGHLGAQQAFPSITGNSYSIFTDLYTQSTSTSSGAFLWINGVNDKDDTGAGDIVMTEAGFTITPGNSVWTFNSSPGTTSIDLTSDTWYTLEIIFDGSGSEIHAIHNIWAQGQRGIGTPLYTAMTIPDDDRDTGSPQGAPSSDFGGPRYSWFTNWNNDAVDALYIDNVGTSAQVVPEPSTFALLGLGGFGLMAYRRRQSRTGGKQQRRTQ